MNKARIAITGMGAVTPIGIGVENYWQALLSGACGIDDIQLIDTSALPVHRAAEIRGFAPKDYLSSRLANDLDRFMQWSCLLCIAAYLCIVLVPVSVIGLLGCAVCGFSVGILWPGTFSKASASMKGGGTAMFAMLALAGDVGCSGGPTLAGFVSSAFGNNLHVGICAALVFPVLMLCSLYAKNRTMAP